MKKSTQAIIDLSLTNIANHLSGFKRRPGQQQMIQAVANTLSHIRSIGNDDEPSTHQGESFLVIEGPTGIGKSLGYLLPALVIAKEQGKKLVVSSATVMLQEQLANKDIPLVARHAGLNISYVLAKGRGRYACTYRLKQQAGLARNDEQSSSQLEMLDNSPMPSASDADLYAQMAKLLMTGQWAGDRDSLTKPVAHAVWSRITTDRHACLKRQCPDFNSCPFFTARNALEQADLIIANHDLLLADIAMGGGIILPQPSETFYCLDEAHHLAAKAIKQFAASHTINGTLAWLEKIAAVVAKAFLLLKDYKPVNNIAHQAESLANYLQDFKNAIAGIAALNPSNKPQGVTAVLRFKFGQVPDELMALCDNLAASSKSLLMSLVLLQEHLKKTKAMAEGQGVAATFDRPLIDLGFLLGRVENLVTVWTLLSQKTPSHAPPVAKWITAEWTFNKNQTESIDYTIHASPVSVAQQLAESFWQNAAGAVLTSATLRSLGSFDLLLTETGLKNFPATTCIALDSPFNFQQQGKLIIPKMHTDPKDPVAHTQEIIDLLPGFLPVSGGNGALVLFTSQQQMQTVSQKLPAHLQTLVLMQGRQAKEVLLDKHFARINSNQPSILFGLASFAEGLDLPGNACNMLIITKIPFAVPDDPISQTYADWIVQKGSDPFMEMTLPAASIKLIQAVGRLIRTETDEGTVIILDKRLETKRYGKLLYKGLPSFKRIIMSREEQVGNY